MKKLNKDLKTKDLPNLNLGLIEVFLIQVVIYALLWIFNDYTATLLTLLLPVIFLSLLLLALAAELIDQSKIPRWYFKFMLISIIAPLITAIFFVAILGTDFAWAKG